MAETASSKVFPPLDTDPSYYNVWSFQTKALLRRKKCIEVISTTRPTTGATAEALAIAQEAYDEKNDQAFGYITERTTRYALSKVQSAGDSAKELWDGLKTAYENKSISNQLNILTRLINLRMPEGSSLDLHFATLDSLSPN